MKRHTARPWLWALALALGARDGHAQDPDARPSARQRAEGKAWVIHLDGSIGARLPSAQESVLEKVGPYGNGARFGLGLDAAAEVTRPGPDSRLLLGASLRRLYTRDEADDHDNQHFAFGVQRPTFSEDSWWAMLQAPLLIELGGARLLLSPRLGVVWARQYFFQQTPYRAGPALGAEVALLLGGAPFGVGLGLLSGWVQPAGEVAQLSNPGAFSLSFKGGLHNALPFLPSPLAARRLDAAGLGLHRLHEPLR